MIAMIAIIAIIGVIAIIDVIAIIAIIAVIATIAITGIIANTGTIAIIAYSPERPFRSRPQPLDRSVCTDFPCLRQLPPPPKTVHEKTVAIIAAHERYMKAVI